MTFIIRRKWCQPHFFTGDMCQPQDFTLKETTILLPLIWMLYYHTIDELKFDYYFLWNNMHNIWGQINYFVRRKILIFTVGTKNECTIMDQRDICTFNPSDFWDFWGSLNFIQILLWNPCVSRNFFTYNQVSATFFCLIMKL